MKNNWFNIDTEHRRTWETFCPLGEFRVVAPDNIPGPLPTALTQKFHSVVVVASGSLDGVAFWMLNGNRPDRPTERYPHGAVDQQPFGLAFVGNIPVGSGCLVQHGKWDGRTTPTPPEFWPQARASGVGSARLELLAPPWGRIEDLAVASQHAAFNTIVASIGREFPQSANPGLWGLVCGG